MPQSAKPRKQHKPKPKFHPVHGSGTMSSQDIVRESLAKSDPNEDWQRAYGAMYAGIQSNKFRMLRHKNSLLFFKVESPIATNVHIFTTEGPAELMKSFIEFGKAFKASGYKQMTGRIPAKDTVLLRLMRRANDIGFKISETPVYAFEGSNKVNAYDVVVEVGK
jgi:hypothetical protein